MRWFAAVCILIHALPLVSKASDEAGLAWSQLQSLHEKSVERVPIGTNAVEFYAGRQKALHDAAAQFARQFPGDDHAPQAILWKIETTEITGSAEQTIALLQQNEGDAQPIIDNKRWPADLRFQFQRTLLTQWLDRPDLIVTSAQAVAIEERIAGLIHENPAEPAALSLQMASVDLMLRFNHEKGVMALKELTRSPDKNFSQAANARLLKEQMVGKPLDLQFTAMDGSSVDLGALRGKVVLLNFWATWCPDCLRETPVLRKSYQKYKDKGLAVVGISLDKDGQALANFIAKKLIPWPQFFDGQGWQSELAIKYGVRAIPETWLIDQRGNVVSTGVPIE
jgi:thiol-disulfide isomerase/thioredoxin